MAITNNTPILLQFLKGGRRGEGGGEGLWRPSWWWNILQTLHICDLPVFKYINRCYLYLSILYFNFVGYNFCLQVNTSPGQNFNIVELKCNFPLLFQTIPILDIPVLTNSSNWISNSLNLASVSVVWHESHENRIELEILQFNGYNEAKNMGCSNVLLWVEYFEYFRRFDINDHTLTPVSAVPPSSEISFISPLEAPSILNNVLETYKFRHFLPGWFPIMKSLLVCFIGNFCPFSKDISPTPTITTASQKRPYWTLHLNHCFSKMHTLHGTSYTKCAENHPQGATLWSHLNIPHISLDPPLAIMIALLCLPEGFHLDRKQWKEPRIISL